MISTRGRAGLAGLAATALLVLGAVVYKATVGTGTAPQTGSSPVADGATAWPVPAEPSLFAGHTLQRQDGQAFDLMRLQGKTVLLNIAFTRCSSTCPATTQQLVALQKQLAAQTGNEVHFVTVSADPLNDTPQSLQAYAQAQGVDLQRWHWLTGDPAQVAALIETLTGRPDPARPDEHLNALLMIDAYGRRLARFNGVQIDQPRLLRELLQLDRGLGAQARRARDGAAS